MIVLVGFMGAGKSVVGRALGQRLGVPFLDLDQEIEKVAGASIPAIFEVQGEASFREMERETLARVLAGAPAVVAAGGGVVDDESNRAALRSATVVFLDATLDEALGRAGGDPGRPMLTRTDPAALYERRRPLYEEVADVVVDTRGLTIDEVVDELDAVLGVERSS